MHALVLDVPDAVQTKAGIAFAEKHGLDCDSTLLCICGIQWKVDLAHVVDQPAHGEHVERSEGALLAVH